MHITRGINSQCPGTYGKEKFSSAMFWPPDGGSSRDYLALLKRLLLHQFPW